ARELGGRVDDRDLRLEHVLVAQPERAPLRASAGPERGAGLEVAAQLALRRAHRPPALPVRADSAERGPRFAPSAASRRCSARTSTAGGAPLFFSARSAAVPAAWPMTKHGPDTRADDWPSCDIDAQRPTTNRFSIFFGTTIRYGIWL